MVLLEIFHSGGTSLDDIIRLFRSYGTFTIKVLLIPPKCTAEEQPEVKSAIDRLIQVLSSAFATLNQSTLDNYSIPRFLSAGFYWYPEAKDYSLGSSAMYDFNAFPIIAVDAKARFYNASYKSSTFALCPQILKPINLVDNLAKQVDVTKILDEMVAIYGSSIQNWIKYHLDVNPTTMVDQIAEELLLSKTFVKLILKQLNITIKSSQAPKESSIEDMKTLFKMAKRVKLDDVAQMLEIARAELFRLVLKVGPSSGVKIDGDFFVMEGANVDVFIKELEDQFSTWGQSKEKVEENSTKEKEPGVVGNVPASPICPTCKTTLVYSSNNKLWQCKTCGTWYEEQ